MMRKLGLCTAALALVSALGACGDEAEILIARPQGDVFRASLTGGAERPNPVTTTATGDFAAQFINFGDTIPANDAIRFELSVAGLTNVTQAHIHAGDANTAGPFMVFLFGPTTVPGPVNGVLRSAEILRTSSFTTGFDFDAVVTRMRDGTAYVNVHTTQNPGGEIRGQVAASSEPFPF